MVCKGDTLLSTLGTNLMVSKGNSHITYIRVKMREMAQLLLTIRKLKEKYASFSISDILKQEMFDTMIEGIQISCRFSRKSKGVSPKFEIPSLAMKIGHSLKKCAYIKQGLCIRNKDEYGEKEVDSFLKLGQMEFTNKFSIIAISTLVCGSDMLNHFCVFLYPNTPNFTRHKFLDLSFYLFLKKTKLISIFHTFVPQYTNNTIIDFYE